MKLLLRIGQAKGTCSRVARAWATYAKPRLAILERGRAPPNLRNSWIQDCLGTSLSVNRKWNHNSSQQRQRALECKSKDYNGRPYTTESQISAARNHNLCLPTKRHHTMKYPRCETVARGSYKSKPPEEGEKLRFSGSNEREHRLIAWQMRAILIESSVCTRCR